MKEVFVDTSSFIALLIETDTNHERAARIAARLQLEKVTLITSSNVIAEVLTVLSMRFSKALAIEFGQKVLRDGLEIIYPDEKFFETAWLLWKKETQKDVSMVDALSFAIIHHYQIPLAFSFDRHFLKRSFEVLD